MKITLDDIQVIRSLLEEIRLYRNEDNEPREMAVDGLYEDEVALAKKLRITLPK